MTYTPPSTKETAFNCPYCEALATQFWFKIYAEQLTTGDPLTKLFAKGSADEHSLDHIEDEEQRKELTVWVQRMVSGHPHLSKRRTDLYNSFELYNLSVSSCFNCRKIAVWIHDQLVFPRSGSAVPANPDMPSAIREDYDEASAILNLSPRGSAALLRLSIQKLCKELGQPGENINDDIAALVKGGLTSSVQQALDIVRVIGNNAVHPGQFDLRDDRAIAETLFKLVNLIVDKTISEPKRVREVYDSLPPGALKQIVRRDGRKF